MQDFKKKTIVVGYSGHGLVLVESALALGHNIYGYCDLNKKAFNPFNIDYLGIESEIGSIFFKSDYQFIIGIGNNEIRKRIWQFIISKHSTVLKVIHPKASVSPNALINDGVFIARTAVINTMAEIGENVIINTGAIIEHECSILSGVHIAPGAVVLGNVKVGAQSFIGSNSIIKEGVVIGENVCIGAGSLVLKDVPDNSICFGSPAKIIK